MRQILLFAALLALLLAGCAAPKTDPGPAETEAETETEAKTETETEAKTETEADTEAEATADYHRITAEEAYEMMVSQEVVIVDVRTPEEYDGGHIPNAILVPNESIGDDMPEALPDKEATLLIYCRSGRRSKEASEKLLKLGYKSIYEFGGIIDWPYELVKEG